MLQALVVILNWLLLECLVHQKDFLRAISVFDLTSWREVFIFLRLKRLVWGWGHSKWFMFSIFTCVNTFTFLYLLNHFKFCQILNYRNDALVLICAWNIRQTLTFILSRARFTILNLQPQTLIQLGKFLLLKRLVGFKVILAQILLNDELMNALLIFVSRCGWKLVSTVVKNVWLYQFRIH